MLKELALASVAGGLAFAIVGGLLWVVLVSMFSLGTLGVVVAIIGGGLSALKWFFASLQESAYDRYERKALDAAIDRATRRAESFEEFETKRPDAPTARGVLRLASIDVNRIYGDLKLMTTSILFATDEGHSLDLPMTSDVEWDVWDGTVILDLSSDMEPARVLGWEPFGVWSLQIQDSDTAAWGDLLTQRGVRRKDRSSAG